MYGRIILLFCRYYLETCEQLAPTTLMVKYDNISSAKT
jgi:hypothetical protein